MHIRPSDQNNLLTKGDTYVLCRPGSRLFVSEALFIPTVGSSPCWRPPPHNASPLLTLWMMRCCGRRRDLRRTGKPDLGRGLLSVRSGMTHLCVSVHAGIRHRHRLCLCVYRYFACRVVCGINHVCSTTPSLCSASFWHQIPNHRLMFCHRKVATYFRNALASTRIH